MQYLVIISHSTSAQEACTKKCIMPRASRAKKSRSEHALAPITAQPRAKANAPNQNMSQPLHAQKMRNPICSRACRRSAERSRLCAAHAAKYTRSDHALKPRHIRGVREEVDCTRRTHKPLRTLRARACATRRPLQKLIARATRPGTTKHVLNTLLHQTNIP